MTEVKQQLIEAANSYVSERVAKIHAAIADLEAALKLETKCSMGDKYETGRAMLHLEFEKLSGQLEQYRKLQKTLHLINTGALQKKVSFGSVVRTTAANYFIAVPAGELQVPGERFFSVGVNSPIAQLLLQKTEGDEFTFNGKSHKILSVG